MVAADYFYPDWGCLVDFFCNLGLKNCWRGQQGIEPTTLDLSSQSGTSQPRRPLSGVEKLLAWLAIEPTTLDLSSQSDDPWLEKNQQGTLSQGHNILH